MDTVEMDLQTKEEIIEQIRQKAESYVPEWRFDAEFPDIGTALALVYGEMFSKTVNKYKQVFLKNKIAFLNELDARLLPAVPARGYVAFSLVNEETQGVELPGGTIVSAQSEDDEVGVINYRTTDDVYVSQARISAFFFVSDQEDFITRLPDPRGIEGETALFDLSLQNLQQHELYFCHEQALYMNQSGWIWLTFYLRGEVSVQYPCLSELVYSGSARFEYYSEGGYVPFGQEKFEAGTILLHKMEGQPPFARTKMEGDEGYFIRCTITEIAPFKNLEFNRMMIGSWGTDILPDSIYANGIESNKKHYLPFGERITNFSEVYFGCTEALYKKGARIMLAFNLDFARIPLDYNVENDPVKWEWIMKRSDFKSDPEYDVTIEEVLWEYYNGTGWARLFADNSYSDVFLPKHEVSREYKRIEFRCPADIEPIVVNSCQSCYIRARIIKVNNLFKMKGSYITPMMEDTVFGYDYRGHEVEPEHLIFCNNLECVKFPEQGNRGTAAFHPFIGTGNSRQALYMGFERPLTEGPLKFLFMFKDNMNRGGQTLLWEYWAGNRWKELNLVDETQGFSRTGIVTMMGRGDHALKGIFGEEHYWLRIVDVNNSYCAKKSGAVLPVLQGIFMNTTKIVNVDRRAEESLRMEVYQENSRFKLPERRIIQAETYVNEGDGIRAEEIEKLTKENRLKLVYDETGVLKEAWVKWNQVEDFTDSGEDDRDYVLEPNEGFILFGNGRNGRIPPSSRTENIRVEYMSGGGAHTNVEADKVKQLDQEIGFISGVTNPQSLSGGDGIESLEHAMVRSCAGLRHQNRAVTVRDYEEIAMAASRSIQRARCFSGYDGQGGKCPGAVTLVVLQKDAGRRRSSFSSVKEEVRSYLKDKVEGNLLCMGRLFIIEPEFVELSVRAELSVDNYNAAFHVKKQVCDRLENFLNPLTGNLQGQGWEIGQLPNNIQIKNAIADIPHLVFVRNIYLSAFADSGMGAREVDLEQVSTHRYVLPVNGRHEVMIDII